jgi:AcrR family transcriptional regulator
MSKVPPSTREATKLETRDALVRAGAMEFAEKGLDAPSLDSICARAGFTRGAFYVHFRDRDELLVAVVDEYLTTFNEAVIAADDAPEDLEQTIARYTAAVAAGAPAVHGWNKWHMHHTLAACARIPALQARYVRLHRDAMDRVARAAEAGQRAGTVRSDVPARALAEILVGLTLGVGVMLDVGIPFDLAADARGVAKLLAKPRPRKRGSSSG